MYLHVKIMNILIIGGNNHISNVFIEKMLYLNIQFRIVIYDNNSSLNHKKKSLFCDVKDYFEYLGEDLIQFVYGDITDTKKFVDTCRKYEINFIINNVKYCPYKSNMMNLHNLMHGMRSICEYSQSSTKLKKVINIQRLYSNDFCYVEKKENICIESHRFVEIQNCMIENMMLDHLCVNIRYEDFVINTLDKNPIIDQYVHMFNIGCVPHAYNIHIKLNKIEDIIAAIIMYIRFDQLKHGNISNIEGYEMNIQNEFLPSIISEFNKTRQTSIEPDYLVEQKQTSYDIRKCEEEFIISALRKSLNQHNE